VGTEPVDYCRQIEAYLCRKNDGHLIRITGPSFEIVSGWAERGVPVNLAFQGIDRSFERYYRKGPRRRPVRIDFCENDVLDVFEEWQRAVGILQSSVASRQSSVESRQSSVSLPVHLERVVLRLTSARARGVLDERFDAAIDRIARELDIARAEARGVRGDTRKALVARLAVLDEEIVRSARATLDVAAIASLGREADDELAGFRASMVADAFARAREAAINRLVRERFGLPTIAFL